MQIRNLARLSLLASITLSAAAQAPLYTYEGSQGDELGHALTFLPDVDGDGVEDFAVGAPDDDPFNDGTHGGSVKLFSGATGIRFRTLAGLNTDRDFGASLAVVPDVNGDGLADLLVGAPNDDYSYNEIGRAFVFGSNDGVIYRTHGSVADTWDSYGASVANVGDTNFDGVDDYAIGAPLGDSNSCDECGKYELFSGATGALLSSWDSQFAYSALGAAVAGGGDLDGDGAADLLVGVPKYVHNGKYECGALFVFLSGTASPIALPGRDAYEHFGSSVVSLGDLDGDARPEFAVGAPHAGPTPWQGRVVVFDGATRSVRYELTGNDGWRFGSALARVGDFDGDGLQDFAVGAPGYERLFINELGLVRVYESGTGTLVKQLFGYDSYSEYGGAIAGACDLNGDAHTELLVGATGDNSFSGSGGAARLLLGGTATPGTYGSPKVNSAACTPRIAFSGAPSLSLGNNFRVRASNVLESKTGMLIWGLAQANTPFHGGSLLVATPIVRTAPQISTPGSACAGAFNFHFSESYMNALALTAGTNVYAQYWYRDAGFTAPNNIGLTDALRFEIAP